MRIAINKLKPNIDLENKITLWLNHLLVLYSFLIPIHNKSKSSLFFVMLLLFIYRMNYIKYLKDALKDKIIQSFLIFYLIGILGLLYTENIGDAISSMDKAKYLLFPLFFLSFFDKRFANRVIIAFFLGMFCSEILSYLIRFEIFPPVFGIGEYNIYKTSIYDPTPFFNHLDHNIGLSIVIAILFYNLINNKIQPLFFKFITVFFITTATLNMSFVGGRVGYVLFLILIFTVLYLSFRNIKKTFLLSLLVLIPISFLSYNFSSMVKNKVDQTINSLEKIIDNRDYKSSIGYRIGFTVYSFEVIKDNPLIGVGTGDYMEEVRNIIPEKHKFLSNRNVLAQPHNVYIKTLLQFGIIGLGSLIYIFYTLLTYKNTTKYNQDILVILCIATIFFMLPGKFYGVFVLPMLVTLISALIVKKDMEIEYNKFKLKTFLGYIMFTSVFLIIGITK